MRPSLFHSLPTRSHSSSLASSLKAYPGASSSPTRRRIAVRLSRCACVPLPLRSCKCSGRSAVSSSVPSPTDTTLGLTLLPTRYQSHFNGCFPLHSLFSCFLPPSHLGGLSERDVLTKRHAQ
ncbi:MFS transporter, SP family, general alpha glucoside:H+ symporter [Cryptococcus neoformans c8]|nr:MFS transporter, SP family, general alpha glucoside:H+ symporter [Cryptococcus neoformans var. grubii Bt15]OXG61577.1 MFS transporter, SP family, general alpha glucoside:H+ symporter [Cryptococcus neoformans var. grubii c8]OXG84166.1 MFS transporter, SP family, general alpha glucoside:H+ symporter [Cryptococcus neoformans var. grubii D17-1]